MISDSQSPKQTRWLDILKAAALLWIFLNHVVERVIDSPLISNPSSNWPPLADRVRQLAPIESTSAVSDVIVNVVRYLGWAGDQGVQLFLIASGFGLTWSLLQRPPDSHWGGFFRRRLWRIFPLWWGAHVIFLVMSMFVGGHGMHPFDPKFYLSLAGFRATTEMIYYFSPAWWYIGLTIQLYLVFPLLAAGLRRFGPGKFLGAVLATSFFVRLVGLATLDLYLDAWSRGAIFITRLPEFAFGMALAWWMYRRPDTTDRFLRSPVTLALGLLTYASATALALTLWGMTVAPFLHGIAAFTWFYALIRSANRVPALFWRALIWLGALSYPLYLTHHPVIVFLLDRQTPPTLSRLALGLPVLAVAIALAIFLVWAVNLVQTTATRWTRGRGNRRAAFRLAVVVTTAAALLLGAEHLIRSLDPQEANGWGERPALQHHDDFGWNLIPNTTTRLRWESYDYTVVANELGFPGPSYPERRQPGTLRVMTLGDAFTSAEGVDTESSWPRLLEKSLGNQLHNTRVEVLNFGITGHGPNQYAAVLEKYGRRYSPDLVLIGFFVNEYFDVTISNEAFCQSIGFDQRDQRSLLTYLEMAHLRTWLQLKITQPLRERVTGKPRHHGYFLGNFGAIEADPPGIDADRMDLVRNRVAAMARLVKSMGSRLILVLIPAPVQVCGPDDLSYYPKNIDISNRKRYDMDLPQRLSLQIADEVGVTAYDLRDTLKLLQTCPYQPQNMHWLPIAHQAAADFVAGSLIRDGFHVQTNRQEEDRQ